MHTVLNRNLFFIKEHTGVFKAANNYDVFDTDRQEVLLNCREENLGFFTKIFRFTDYKRTTPFHIEVKTPTGEKVLTVKRGFTMFASNVQVLDENDTLVGSFRQKLFSIGGKFKILDPNGVELCVLQGKWTSWEYKFIKDNNEFAFISKDFESLAKELFTTADNYYVKIEDTVPANNRLRILILAAAICIDMVLKE